MKKIKFTPNTFKSFARFSIAVLDPLFTTDFAADYTDFTSIFTPSIYPSSSLKSLVFQYYRCKIFQHK